FTDGGIKLDKKWLEELVRPVRENGADAVYGAYEPILDSFIKECSLIAYVPAKASCGWPAFRTDFIASSLFKKHIWKGAGGFPPFRAAEDKIFMDKVRKTDAKIKYADKALVYWQIPASIKEIFQRFREFSAHDILAARTKDWHRSVFRTYGLLLLFLALGIFISPLFFWCILGIWVLRVMRIFFKKSKDFKYKFALNPFYLFAIQFIVLVTDMAMFCGVLKSMGMRYGKNK
ncbi:glycosyltransferase, partial [Candidatus Omnitrophota bacterium]